MNFKALIFDFNGLIVDDEPVHFELFRKVLAEEEIELDEQKYWDIYLGFDDKGLFEEIFRRNNKKLTPKKLKELIQKKTENYLALLAKKFKIFPGVDELIRWASKKLDLAIVSGALRPEIDLVLQKSNLTSFFPLIISAEETKHGKPDPEGFLIALARLKKKNPEIRPENCLVLEDSLAGIESAKRARMKCAALTHSYSREQLIGADIICDTFQEVQKFLEKGNV